MNKDALTTNEIRKHLLAEARQAKLRVAAKQIEAAGESLLGDDYNFAMGREAAMLAEASLASLEMFMDKVRDIRTKLDSQFNEVVNALGDEHETE